MSVEDLGESINMIGSLLYYVLNLAGGYQCFASGLIWGDQLQELETKRFHWREMQDFNSNLTLLVIMFVTSNYAMEGCRMGEERNGLCQSTATETNLDCM